jgi:hypothetical protein
MRFNDSLECIPWPRRQVQFSSTLCAQAPVIRALLEHFVAGHLPRSTGSFSSRSHDLGS